MKVFKFGGASIKSADAIRNMANIIASYANEGLIVVVSAMGKSTNALEKILHEARELNKIDIDDFMNYHLSIVNDLLGTDNAVKSQLNELKLQLLANLELELNYDEHYDQVISFGELFSSTIISAYLNQTGIPCQLKDARHCIFTSDDYRNGHVLWDKSHSQISSTFKTSSKEVYLTQGFIGISESGQTTTLGREGSDFTAAIIASCLDAESVTVWKDVPGILNADPKLIDNAQLFDDLNYKEAAEMSYYGASVIHPKTIKPLALKNIPLYVRSFDRPSDPGTLISAADRETSIPTIVIKKNQCLLSFKVLDYTFINEDNLSLIFKEFASLDVKINIMQNSAISFSAVIDYRKAALNKIIDALRGQFDIRYNTGLTLITIKNYNTATVDQYRKGKNILLEQTSRNNYRALFSD